MPNLVKNSPKWQALAASRFASSSCGRILSSSSLNTARQDGSIPTTGMPART